MSTIARPPLHKVARWQLVFLSLLSIVLLPFGWGTSVSVWVGGMIHIIPHAWFAEIAFTKAGSMSPLAGPGYVVETNSGFDCGLLSQK